MIRIQKIRDAANDKRPDPPVARRIEMVSVEVIDVLERHREVRAADVDLLVESFRDLGMRTPISVRYFPNRPSRGGTDDSYVLVAGAHRLAAAKAIGWTKVECFIIDDEDEAELWEIAENLHRAELTALERDEQIARWIELTQARNKPAQSAPVSGGRGKVGGINAAVRELGIERTHAQRAVKVASLAPEAKAAARDAGLDNNRAALLKVAKVKPADQVEALHNIADRPGTDRRAAKAHNNPPLYDCDELGDPTRKEDRAALSEAVVEAAIRGIRGQAVSRRASNKNPLHEPDPAYDALLAFIGPCRSLIERTKDIDPAFAWSGAIDDAMRKRHRALLREAVGILKRMIEVSDA